MKTSWWVLNLLVVIVACLVVGCPSLGGLTSSTDPTLPAADRQPDTPIVVPDIIPDVDLSRHSVPLDQVYFDTFQSVNRAVPLTNADADLIARLRDAIPPIHAPSYETAADATWLTADDAIVGYAADGQAWAYPIRILNFHEIVNDTLAGEPALISFCPLCYSGIVFSRQLDEQLLTFGNTSALYESDMVMLDYETGSYWWQVAGQAIVGELTDAELTVLPSMTTTWAQWQELHPNTLVLSRDTGFPRDYSRNPFADYADYVDGGRFAFPVSEASLDARLSPGTKVLAVKTTDEVRVYSLAQDARTTIADTIDGEDAIVFIDPASASGGIYRPMAGDRPLTISVQDGAFVDVETGSVWNLAGHAISGPLAGTALTALPSRTTFWFAIIAAEPDAIIGG